LKKLTILLMVCAGLINCRPVTDRCETGELSQAECCESDPIFCAKDAGNDTAATDSGQDVPDADSDTGPDATPTCDPACVDQVCDNTTNTCVDCVTSTDCSGTKTVCDPSAQQCVTCLTGEGCTATQICDTENDTCVECLGDLDCGNGEVCDTASNLCVACLETTDCTSGLCKQDPADSANNACVECLDNTVCTTDTKSRCDATSGTCSACVVAADCGGIAGTKQCNAGTCVACTPTTEIADCAMNNENFACDPATFTCTDIKLNSGGTCQECVGNSSCVAGFACMPTTFGGAPAGNYCMKISDGNTCPGPYGTDVVTRNDVGGTEVDVCMINETILSCAAFDQYGDICTADNGTCTAAGSTCKQFNVTTRRCTYQCNFDNDCKGTETCNTIGANFFCGATGN
jgi:Cys-rich repeat protein